MNRTDLEATPLCENGFLVYSQTEKVFSPYGPRPALDSIKPCRRPAVTTRHGSRQCTPCEFNSREYVFGLTRSVFLHRISEAVVPS